MKNNENENITASIVYDSKDTTIISYNQKRELIKDNSIEWLINESIFYENKNSIFFVNVAKKEGFGASSGIKDQFILESIEYGEMKDFDPGKSVDFYDYINTIPFTYKQYEKGTLPLEYYKLFKEE